MEGLKKKRLLPLGMVLCLLLLVVISPAGACPSDGGDCRNCITNRMKTDCPKCAPIMRCMARCLWGGASKTKCVKKCDCNGGYPKVSDCKNCLYQCKCSCAV